MYLDPGVTGMAIQAVFALIATLLTAFSVPRRLIRIATDAARRLSRSTSK